MWGEGVLLGGRYQLIERVGVGSMGEVWRAWDSTLERAVAVKVMLPALLEEAGFAARFLREARILAALDHPGIVKVHDYGENADPHAVFLVMELVEGRSLSALLTEQGALDPALAMSIAAQTLEALAAAHARGIVHRDVKPMNLLLRGTTVTVADFGVAYDFGAQRLTSRGMTLGTVLYSAPEQAQFGVATPSADLYSVGVIAYECLSGQLPFIDDDGRAVLLKHAHDPVPPLPAHIPTQVRDVVLRALAKAPADRFADAAHMAAAARAAGALGPAAGPGNSRASLTAGARRPAPTLADETGVSATLPVGQAPRESVLAGGAPTHRRRYAFLAAALAVLIVGSLATYLATGGGPGKALTNEARPSVSLSVTSPASASAAGQPDRPAAASGAASRTIATSSPAPGPAGPISAPTPGSPPTAVYTYPVSPGSPYPGVFASDSPSTVSGVLSCQSGAVIAGVWVQAVQDGHPGSGFAAFQITPDGEHTKYWFALPRMQTYDLSIGCGKNSAGGWAATVKADGLTSPTETFKCYDEPGDVNYPKCLSSTAG